jgi:hypothetical protein
MDNKPNSQTLVFVDDSGDPGFKFRGGSSSFFIISAVIFNDTLEAEKTSIAIKELKRKLNFPENNFEFKFCKSSKETRIRFLESVKPFDFKIRYLVVDKRKIRSDELKNNKNSFYSYIIKMLLMYSNNSILDAKLRIDGSGDRIFRRNFSTYLRKSLNSSNKKIIKSLKLVDSKENTLIQLADMVAGSEYRYFEFNKIKKDYDVYRNIIKKRIQDEWEFK